MTLKVGSLFSGIGGIELGLEKAGGFETKWFVENDQYARAVLKKHWPNTKIYDDVTKVDWASVPGVDVLTGGFPCQDISNAGKRVGIEGSRSSLWKDYLKAISSLRPQFVVAENVSALTQRGLDTVLRDLAKIRYDAEWYCFPASCVGAHHQRDRIIILGYPNDNGLSTSEKQTGIIEGSDCCEEGEEQTCESPRSSIQYGNVADSELCGCLDGQSKEFSDETGEPSQSYTRESSQEMADTNSRRLERSGEKGWGARDVVGCCAEGWWAVEPDVGRVAYGVSSRVDRIKCLGNAVVPAWAEAIGKAIGETK